VETIGRRWADKRPGVEAPGPGRLASLRRRYHELGAANPYAVEEYAALRRRLEELESQHGDLRAAIDQTRSLIAELDAMITEQFRSTFRALETRFDARFQQLFGGGFARLSLTDPTDLAATGIEIVARPPGKKPQALAMLSGGERALTAVALLFAMLEVRPVPFCVLDEVDAALDEANVGRFTTALRELSATTQFVVITHNRGTIEIADALYGVTAGDDSVSRVISLRLDEATEIAERSVERVAVGPGRDSV
jgi:chromosome segregation protein